MDNNIAFAALEKIGWGSYNFKVFVMCGIAWMNFEAWLVAIAYIIQGIHEEFKTPTALLGVFGSFFNLGMLFGGITWGTISDKKGRIIPYRLSSIAGLASGIIILLSFHPWMVGCGILLLGFTISADLILSPTIFSEFCPPSKRYLMILLAFFINLGAIAATVIALIVKLLNTTSLYTWRILVFTLVFIQVVSLILRFFLDETPAYLIRAKKFQESEEILNKISLANTNTEYKSEGLITENHEKSASVMTEIQENPPVSLILKKLFGPKLRWTTLKISTVLYKQAYVMALFAFVGLVFFMPEFLSFMPVNDAYIVMAIQQTVSIPASITGTFMARRMKRKWISFIGFFFAGVFSILFYLSEDYYYVRFMKVTVTTSCLFFFACLGFSSLFSAGSLSFPTQVRSTGTSMVSIISRIGGISAPIVCGVVLPMKSGFFIILCLLGGANIICSLIMVTLNEKSEKQNLLKDSK